MIVGPFRMTTTIRKSLVIAAIGLSALASATFDVTAKSAIIIDADSGKVLWEKDADTPRYPASTTKIMTGLLLVERCLPDDIIVAPKGIDQVKEASIHLKPGEKLTAKDMLYALMLRSANDGCVAVACHISGSVPEFVKLMNKRAKELGCTHTFFHNPNGLNDNLHKISARDLAIIARAAMRYETFRKAVRTQKVTIVRSSDSKDLLLKNHNKWLPKDSTADGIKTGWTIPAGRCYVGSATRNGYRVITVVLKSEDWQIDHQNMLAWAFKNYDRSLYAAKGSGVGKIAVPQGALPDLAVKVNADVYHIVQKGSSPAVTLTQEVKTGLQAPVAAGDEVGTVTYSDGTGWQVKAPLVAAAAMAKAVPVTGTTGSRAVFGILGGALVVGTLAFRTRRKRAKFYAKAPRIPFS